MHFCSKFLCSFGQDVRSPIPLHIKGWLRCLWARVNGARGRWVSEHRSVRVDVNSMDVNSWQASRKLEAWSPPRETEESFRNFLVISYCNLNKQTCNSCFPCFPENIFCSIANLGCAHSACLPGLTNKWEFNYTKQRHYFKLGEKINLPFLLISQREATDLRWIRFL